MSRDYFGKEVAESYDNDAEMFDPAVVDPAVDFLAELAGEGQALEFGIGTGRIALPLLKRGVKTAGIDLSEAMLEKLREKHGAKELAITPGDFSTTRVQGEFSLVYLVFNTIMNLTTQEQQVACFRNAADHLVEGGTFVIEVMVPDLQRLPAGEIVRPFSVTTSHLGFDEYDLKSQGLISHHFNAGEDGKFKALSIPFRYVWPAELDLMAQLAGMRLSERFEDWDRTPFTSESRKHVSVWQKG
jgi:cyclopropane fatty-acyl-phospholipid synthase-like methyltransferase